MTANHSGVTEAVRVLVPVGMLGGGFPSATIARGIELGADVIAVDGGSTDSGPHYLGTATAKTARGAVARDLRHILPAAGHAGIPLIVGSCGTSGTDAGVDWVHGILTEVAAESGTTCRVARIYAEQDPAALVDLLRRGRIRPLEPAGVLDEATLRRCTHVVGLMGHEPITGVLVTIDRDGSTGEPLDETARCTPTSIAAHMMYENTDPFRMREPAGTLDTTDAVYTAIDKRSVRVEGSRFEPSGQHTIKLEGAAAAGSQTMIVSGIRDPRVLGRLDEWCDQLLAYLYDHLPTTVGLLPGDYDIRLLRYGHDAVLGAAEPRVAEAPKEVAIVFLATAADQATATQIAKFANRYSSTHRSLATRPSRASRSSAPRPRSSAARSTSSSCCTPSTSLRPSSCSAPSRTRSDHDDDTRRARHPSPIEKRRAVLDDHRRLLRRRRRLRTRKQVGDHRSHRGGTALQYRSRARPGLPAPAAPGHQGVAPSPRRPRFDRRPGYARRAVIRAAARPPRARPGAAVTTGRVRLIGPSDLPVGHPGRVILTGWTPLIASQVDARFSYCTYVPKTAPASGAPVVVAVHSTGRDVHGTLEPWIECAVAHGAIVLAPLFPGGVGDPNDLNNYKTLLYRGVRFDLILLGMLEEAAQRWHFDDRRFVLYGFSGGGQFVHRFAYLHPGRRKAVVVGAPGSVTLPDDTRAWPEGTGDIEAVFGIPLELDALRSVPFRVLVGELDTDTANMAPGTPPGDTRLRRALALTGALARAAVPVEIQIVAGVGHEAGAVTAAATSFVAEVLERGRA